MSQLISDTIKKAIDRALQLNLPFAAFAMPGSSDIQFMASQPVDGSNAIDMSDPSVSAFVITMFAAKADSAVGIRNQYSASDVIALPDSMKPFDSSMKFTRRQSTPYHHYIANIHEAQSNLRYSLKKVVMSRRISTEIDGSAVALAEAYFNELPDTFRALYFTQETGLWLTATPERLLSYDSTSSTFSTMALAGTRYAASLDEPWDEKNTLEHNVVVRHINNVFLTFGLDTRISAPTYIPFGNIHHLCHSITAEGRTDPLPLVDCLNPTPAVAGYPVNRALGLISRFEPHERNCYSGWLGLKRGGDLDLYVNLRCAMLEQTGPRLSINIICGGGIMRESDPRSEWIEAGEKATPLWNAVKSIAGSDTSGLSLSGYHVTTIPGF